MNPILVLPPNLIHKYTGCVIDVTSHSTTQGKWLSPFYLGPVNLHNNNKSLNLENAWQFSKVYSEHYDPNTDTILPEYYDWAAEGWSAKKAFRYPMGKGRKPLFSLWGKNRYTYTEARKKIYIPLYTQVAQKNRAFSWLKEIYKKEEQLILVDFDSYDYNSLGYNWNNVIYSQDRKMGHGFVIAMMLEGYNWEEATEPRQKINIFSGSKEASFLSNCTVLAKQKRCLEKDYPIYFRGKNYADAEAVILSIGKNMNFEEKKELCFKVIATKLSLYPELVDFIDINGGIEWLKECTHYTQAVSDNFKAWEGDGENSVFIQCLIKGYNAVKNRQLPEPIQQTLF